MTKKKNNEALNKPLTQEFVEKTMQAFAKEVSKELKAEVASLQIKVDANSLMKLGLDRLGLKKNWTERAVIAAISFMTGGCVGALSMMF